MEPVRPGSLRPARQRPSCVPEAQAVFDSFAHTLTLPRMPRVAPRVFDMRPMLWPDYDASALDLGLSMAHRIVRQGGPGSLEPGATLDYRVVDGEQLQKHRRWWALWQSQGLKDQIEALTGDEVLPAADIRGGFNINLLAGKGASYEWHVDAQAYTVVLFTCDLEQAEDGGGFAYVENGQVRVVEPRRGRAVVFDGVATPHCVLPLKRDMVRTTVVMEMLSTTTGDVRDEKLSGFLY